MGWTIREITVVLFLRIFNDHGYTASSGFKNKQCCLLLLENTCALTSILRILCHKVEK